MSEHIQRIPIHAETCLRDPAFVMSGTHCHSCFELFYTGSGECRFLIEDQWYDLREGDFILIPPMALHYTRYPREKCVRTVILFHQEDISPEVRQCMPGQEHFFTEIRVFHTDPGYRPVVTDLIARLTEECAREMPEDDLCSFLLRRLILQSLFLRCSRICTFISNLPSDIHTDNRQMLEAASYIARHYMNPVTTGDVAAAVGFSPNYLSRRFRQATGIGLHEYLVFVRLHHAAQELLSTRDSITDIALRCGFSDSNYFKDSFKKKYGVTPRHFRKMA